ncbi:uncharacterized protein LOC142330248 isoform X2 [Lycorma delicatula]|uniref:uncharacterized protein LOC142330248 isoform X2 n=1 Tax=Lycorma delicatula TaxID=130591 RepID=UPI003F5101A0
MKLTRKCKLQSRRLVNASWNLCFYFMSVYLGYTFLIPNSITGNNIENMITEISDNCNKTNKYMVMDPSLFFALSFGFYAHNLFEYIINIKNKKEQLYSQFFISALLITAVHIRGTEFALILSTIINLPNFMCEMSKLFYNLSIISNSYISKIGLCISLLMYIFLWILVNIWLIPQFFFLSVKDNESYNYFITFNLLLWIYTGSELISCVCSRIIMSLFLKRSTTISFEYYLYGIKNINGYDSIILNHTESNINSTRLYESEKKIEAYSEQNRTKEIRKYGIKCIIEQRCK